MFVPSCITNILLLAILHIFNRKQSQAARSMYFSMFTLVNENAHTTYLYAHSTVNSVFIWETFCNNKIIVQFDWYSLYDS